jgi:hypothetical protein
MPAWMAFGPGSGTHGRQGSDHRAVACIADEHVFDVRAIILASEDQAIGATGCAEYAVKLLLSSRSGAKGSLAAAPQGGKTPAVTGRFRGLRTASRDSSAALPVPLLE